MLSANSANQIQGSIIMRENKEKTKSCKCEHCHCDIPLSSALSSEGAEYTSYFCGPDCFKKHQEENKQRNNED